MPDPNHYPDDAVPILGRMTHLSALPGRRCVTVCRAKPPSAVRSRLGLRSLAAGAARSHLRGARATRFLGCAARSPANMGQYGERQAACGAPPPDYPRMHAE